MFEKFHAFGTIFHEIPLKSMHFPNFPTSRSHNLTVQLTSRGLHEHSFIATGKEATTVPGLEITEKNYLSLGNVAKFYLSAPISTFLTGKPRLFSINRGLKARYLSGGKPPSNFRLSATIFTFPEKAVNLSPETE